MTVRVMLVAHGATSATRATAFPRDETLEPAALDDARALGGTLPMNAARAILLAGPEIRCQQTAFQLGLTAAETDSCISDWDAGSWAGLSLAELLAVEPSAVQQWLQDADFTPPGGESQRELLQRIGTWLDERPASSRTIAVTHPAVMRAAAVHALTAGPDAFWRIDVPPLSTLSVSGGSGRWSVRLH